MTWGGHAANLWRNHKLGALPLPCGERVGVRGLMNFVRIALAPSPGAQERADLSPLGRGGASGARVALTLQLAGAILITASAAAQADGDAARGEKRFEECVACHRVEAGQNAVGPSLHGVFQRRAGELGDYRYSPALKRSGIVWTAETLDAFIADPQKAVPANRMPYAGMPDAGDRADLIAYLMKASR